MVNERTKPADREHPAATIRRAEMYDMDALLTIERQCFNVYYYDFYMLDRRDFEFYLQDADSLFFVAVREDQVVGYVLGPVDSWRDPPRAHIDSIAVLPQVHRTGIGDRLLRCFTARGRREGCTRVTLEVSTANNMGLAFFRKNGFREIRELPNYYGKGLDGLFMALELR